MYTWIRIEIGWQIFNSQIIMYIAQYYKMVLIFNIIRVGTYQTFSFISFQPSDYQYTLLEYFMHYEVPPSTVMQWYMDSMSRTMVDYYVRDLEDWTELASATEFVSASLLLSCCFFYIKMAFRIGFHSAIISYSDFF